MNFKIMLMSAALMTGTMQIHAQGSDAATVVVEKPRADFSSGRLTPESLWSMGRIGNVSSTTDGKVITYAVTYYDIKSNKGNSVIYVKDLQIDKTHAIFNGGNSPVFIKNGKEIAFLSSRNGSSQVWSVGIDGKNARQISHAQKDVEGFLFSPDEKKVILIHSVDNNTVIEKKENDLPLATGMVINDLMYKHWDQYNTSSPHPFIADFDGASNISEGTDMLEGEPFECPMIPFGGVEQLAWSPDSKSIAYTCRKKVGKEYATSTDSDIFLYDLSNKTTKNLCKPSNYAAPSVIYTKTLQDQSVNKTETDCNVGYDQNPQFSPNGRYIAWTSMERDGYESDRTRLCVYDFKTGTKSYVTEVFESGVNEFGWDADNNHIFFSGVWHGQTQLYRTDLKGHVKQLTNDTCDYSLVQVISSKLLLAKRQSMQRADEVYLVNVRKDKGFAHQVTFENKNFYDNLEWGDVKARWVKTIDGKQELCWVIYPPKFDASKKYPALLFCEGGPQSPVSQFWSFRWNMQIMAANDYIVIAPNRRGLPGFGMEWLEEISGDYTGLCMQDYLSAIDDLCKETYVDKERLGAVGASFGGFSVYWLAGNHNKRFKAFIAHDGIYNTQQQYVETEELWFPNWDLKSAPWEKTAAGEMQKAYATSPHLYVDKWDTPILCIHGQKDFRIEYTQAESAFTAARMRGIDAQMLLFPDENHWVLKPQNGILWQRTFFRWLNKYLKK